MKPVLMPVIEVLDALAWHIASAYPQFVDTPHKQVWCSDGVVLVPLEGAQGNGTYSHLNGAKPNGAG